MKSESAIIVGVVGKPFGLRGDVYVRPDPDVDFAFEAGEVFDTSVGTLTVAEAWDHAGRTIVRFAEAADRQAAGRLRGAILTVARDRFRLEDDAYWTSDLLGLEVVDEQDTLVGVLEGVMDGHAHDYFVVARTDGGEVLVPAVPELVTVEDDRIVVQAIPGLLDAADDDRDIDQA